MPQWDFLDFLAVQARRYPNFHLHLQTRAAGLLFDGGSVAGVRAETPGGGLEIRAPLTVAADGRDSVLRAPAGLTPRALGAPMDVLWLRLPKRADDPHETFGYVRAGRIIALIDRGEYWQCAYVIPKGTFEELRGRGIAALQTSIGGAVPFLADRTADLRSWDDVKLLTVRVDRLRRWYRDG